MEMFCISVSTFTFAPLHDALRHVTGFAVAVLAASMPFAAQAIGVSAVPGTLLIETRAGQEGTARFTVRNPSNEVALYEAYPEEFSEYLALMPRRFILEAGERRDIFVHARSRGAGVMRTAVAVEAHPLGKKAGGIGGGVRVPLSVVVGESRSGLLSAAAAGGKAAAPAFAVLALFWAVLAFRARRKHPRGEAA